MYSKEFAKNVLEDLTRRQGVTLITDLSDDQMKGFEYIMKKLSGRDVAFIKVKYGFYGDGVKTFADVAKTFGVNTSRAIQLVNRAFSFMSKPLNFKYIENGHRACEVQSRRLAKELKIPTIATKTIYEVGFDHRLINGLESNDIGLLYEFIELVKSNPDNWWGSMYGVGITTASHAIEFLNRYHLL